VANLDYTAIETRVMNQLRLPVTNTTEQAKINALINEVYRDLYAKADWYWLVKYTTLNTVPVERDGTVSVTNGSPTITWSIAKAITTTPKVLLVTGQARDTGGRYRIVTPVPVADLAATLESPYAGTTNTAATYRLYQDQYDLPADFGKLLRIGRSSYRWAPQLIAPDEMYELKGGDQREGAPQWACVWDFDTTGDPSTARQLVIHPYPDQTYQIDLHYKRTLNTELSGTTIPLIPDEFRHLLIYGALSRGYPIFMNDIERGRYYQALFNDMLLQMTAAQRDRQNENPRIQIRDQYRTFYRSRGRLSPARADLGSMFDRWP
jgi:hypothetical protein